MKTVPLTLFGKDHFSLLAFIDYLCTDYGGMVSDKHRRSFRTNLKRHPGYGYFPSDPPKWKNEHGTRLKGWFDKKDPKLQIKSHDDWDIVDDFEKAGILENKGSGLNPLFVLTPMGQALAALLRKHKQEGKNFSDFTPSAAAKEA